MKDMEQKRPHKHHHDDDDDDESENESKPFSPQESTKRRKHNDNTEDETDDTQEPPAIASKPNVGGGGLPQLPTGQPYLGFPPMAMPGLNFPPLFLSPAHHHHLANQALVGQTLPSMQNMVPPAGLGMFNPQMFVAGRTTNYPANTTPYMAQAMAINNLSQQIRQQQETRTTSTANTTAVGNDHPNQTTDYSTNGDDEKLSGRAPISLYMSCDDESLSEYQCLVRKQIEIFEAMKDDVDSNAQGRNRPIVLGQVGIRCRHCTMLPPKHRARGAVYYPAKLQGLYQAAQNMATSHLCEHCQHVPEALRDELLRLKDRKSSAGGGKKYWADGVRVLGVYEDGNGLRFEQINVKM